MLVFHTATAAETKCLGRKLARALKPGDVVGFHGELGAGKTTMISGIAAGLGVREGVKSPTFVIATQYDGVIPVFHIDLYRVAGEAELGDLGLEELLDGRGVVLIEWAERMDAGLPERTISVRLMLDGTGRKIEVSGPERLTAEMR